MFFLFFNIFLLDFIFRIDTFALNIRPHYGFSSRKNKLQTDNKLTE